MPAIGVQPRLGVCKVSNVLRVLDSQPGRTPEGNGKGINNGIDGKIVYLASVITAFVSILPSPVSELSDITGRQLTVRADTGRVVGLFGLVITGFFSDAIKHSINRMASVSLDYSIS